MDSLPSELLLAIFSFRFRWRDLLAMRAVCHRWYLLLRESSCLYLTRCPPPAFLCLFPRLCVQTIIKNYKGGVPLISDDPRLLSRSALDVVLEDGKIGCSSLYFHLLVLWASRGSPRTLMIRYTRDYMDLLLGYGNGTLSLCFREWSKHHRGEEAWHLFTGFLELLPALLPITQMFVSVSLLSSFDTSIFQKIAGTHPGLTFFLEPSLLQELGTQYENLSSNFRTYTNEERVFPHPSDPRTQRLFFFNVKGKNEYQLVGFPW